MANFHGSVGFLAFISCLVILQNCCQTVNSSRLQSSLFANFLTGDHKVKVHDTLTTGGTRWAVLVAGSTGWWNYRHQVLYIYTYTRFYIYMHSLDYEFITHH